MSNASEGRPTRPSPATRAEEERDARVGAGPDEIEDAPDPTSDEVDEEVAEHYEEMIERGAEQRGEGRLP